MTPWTRGPYARHAAVRGRPGGSWSGSRVSGSNLTLKTLELLNLQINFSNFSDFELPQVNNFSNFSHFRQNFRKRACRAQLSFWRKETLAQIADIEKVAIELPSTTRVAQREASGIQLVMLSGRRYLMLLVGGLGDMSRHQRTSEPAVGLLYEFI